LTETQGILYVYLQQLDGLVTSWNRVERGRDLSQFLRDNGESLLGSG
jgi:hypothetical protein